MSLDGLRAWIGLVERKLTMRTRVFLVLVAIAVGGAGAAIYLALDAKDDAVSKDEVAALQEQAGAAAGAAETGSEAAALSSLEAEVEALRDQVAELVGTAAPVESTGATELEAEIEALRGEVAALREANAQSGPGEAQKPSGGTAGAASTPHGRQQLKAAGEEAIEEARSDKGK